MPRKGVRLSPAHYAAVIRAKRDLQARLRLQEQELFEGVQRGDPKAVDEMFARTPWRLLDNNGGWEP